MIDQSLRGPRALMVIGVRVAILTAMVDLMAGEDADGPGPIVYRPPVRRWRLPPIASPYFIGWYGAHSPSRPRFETALLLDTQTVETDAPVEDLRWWYGRGVMGCPWAAGTLLIFAGRSPSERRGY